MSKEDTVVEEPAAVKEDVFAAEAVDMVTVELDNGAVAVEKLEDMPVVAAADEVIMDDWAASSNV